MNAATHTRSWSFDYQNALSSSLFSSKRKKASHHNVGTSKSGAKLLVPITKKVVNDVNSDYEAIPHNWIWRILKMALPFQLALVALFGVACLLEPRCCEAMNTLNFSFTPQLRYLQGPPPI